MAKKINTSQMVADLIDKFGSQREAAKACGLSQGTLSLLLNNKLGDVKLSTIQALERGAKAKKTLA